MWTLSIVQQFRKMGFQVDVWSRVKGQVSTKLKAVKTLKPKYDLILVNHNKVLKKLLAKNIKGFKIMTCHGIYPFLEQPCPGADMYASISEEVAQHLDLMGYNSTIIKNGVDLQKFKPEKPLNEKLTNILILAKGYTARNMIIEACEKRGLYWFICQNQWHMEKIINDFDLVISLGRGAVEALACGREVLILDSRDYSNHPNQAVGDGLFSTHNKPIQVMGHNYSGRSTKYSYEPIDILREFDNYSNKHINHNRQWAVKYHNIENTCKKYLEIYERYQGKIKTT